MFDPISYELAKKYTNDKLEKLWTDADVLDFTKEFDFAESIMQGGAMVEKTLEFEGINIGPFVVAAFQSGPKKIKVALNGEEGTLFVFAQNFATHSQYTDFIVYGDSLLYMYLLVGLDGTLRFQCKEITTSPYVPA